METKEKNKAHDWENWPSRNYRSDRIFRGLIVVGVGILLLAKKKWEP